MYNTILVSGKKPEEGMIIVNSCSGWISEVSDQ